MYLPLCPYHIVLITVIVYEAIIMGRVILQAAFFFSENCFSLGPVPFHINFRISLSAPTKTPARILIEIMLNL